MDAERRRFFILGFLVLIGVCFAVFGRSIGFGFVDYDDPAYVTDNGYVNEGLSWVGVKWAFTYQSGGRELFHLGTQNVWHPLTWLSHMLDVSLFGLDGVWGHHLMNVLLHAVGACLAFIFFAKLVKNGWVGFWAALFFVVHPMKVESVAWISERKDLLSGAFFWASMASVVCFFEGKRSFKAVGLVCFVLACLSKPSVVILPGLVILAEGYYREEKKWALDFWIKGLKEWWAWFAVSFVTAGLTVFFQQGGSHADFIEGSLVMRLMSMMPGVLFYCWRTLVPWDLNFHYPMIHLAGLKGQVIAVVSALLVITTAGVLWRNRQTWRRAFFAGLWLFLCWLPMSGLVYVGTSFTTDRYMYLAMSGPFLWLASYLVKMSWGKWLGVALVLVWSALAFVQTGVWKNSHTLFSHAVKAQPMDTLAWANLGSVYQRSGDYEKGVEYHSKAVSISKNEYNSWYNLGYCWEKMGDKEKAMENYERSLEAYPRYIPAMKNWGSLLEEEGDKMAARDLFWRAAEADRFREEAIVRRLLRVELELRNTDGIRQLLQKMAASGNRYSPELEAGIKQLKQQVGYSN